MGGPTWTDLPAKQLMNRVTAPGMPFAIQSTRTAVVRMGAPSAMRERPMRTSGLESMTRFRIKSLSSKTRQMH